MASKQMYGVLAVMILTVLPAIAFAKVFVVGDEKGWTIKFDYQAWAADKVFRVGDQLVFKYPLGSHNVFKVNGTAFKDCIVPPANESMITGNDVIALSTPGRKWYICGVGKHCADGGQKLAITVEAAWEGPSVAPTPCTEAGTPTSNSANGVLASGYHALLAAISLFAMVVMVRPCGVFF